MLNHCRDRYKTQKMCNKAVDSYLPTLKFIPDWFVISEMIEKANDAVLSNDDIVFGDLDSYIVKFFSSDVGINSINLNKLILLMIVFTIATVNH